MARGRLLALALTTALVSACATPPTAIDQAGRLEVLGPGAGFSPDAPPADWVIEGAPGPGRLEVGDVQGIRALRILNGDERFTLVRRTRAILLAMPYLSWAWSMDIQRSGPHPVHLVVGFDGGNPDGQRGGGSFSWFGSSLPAHDRLLKIAWGESALQRGSLIPTSGEDPPVPRYTVRGGRENAGFWRLETVDLSRLYSLAWPDDDMGRVNVSFIGISADGSRPPAAANISGILLSR
jgi:hypothetical protein